VHGLYSTIFSGIKSIDGFSSAIYNPIIQIPQCLESTFLSGTINFLLEVKT